MKTYREFREDVAFAHDNLMLEAKGFGDIAKKRRNKRASRSALRGCPSRGTFTDLPQ